MASAVSRALPLSAGATVDSRSIMMASPPSARAAGKLSGRELGVRNKLRQDRRRVRKEAFIVCLGSAPQIRAGEIHDLVDPTLRPAFAGSLRHGLSRDRGGSAPINRP